MSERLRIVAKLQYAAQVFVLVISCWLSYRMFIRIEGIPPFRLGSSMTLITFSSLLTVWGIVFSFSSESRPSLSQPFRSQVRYLTELSLIAVLVYSAIGFLFHFTMLSRLMVIAYALNVFLLFLLIAYSSRRVIRMILARETKILVLSNMESEQANAVYRELRAGGMEVSGVVFDQELSAEVPFLGYTKNLAQILESTTIDSLILHPSLTPAQIERCVGESQLRGIPSEFLIGRISLQAATREVVAMPYGTAIRLLPHRSAPLSTVLKRLTDVTLSLFGLIVLSPVFLIIALMIKLTSPGTVLFAQERVGLRGRIFRCLKFRTMVVNAEALKEDLLHLNEMSGPVFKIKNDPRVTRIGGFLRKTSLDELPQLWNVLVGDMSIVGPRPPLPSEVSQYEPWQRRRLSVRPGITCLWQISGRNDIDFDAWMALDLAYIDQWSYFRDWWIMLKTVPAVLLRKGAS